MTSRRAKAYLFLIITSLLWGFASPVIKFTLEGLDPGPFLIYRFFISSIIALFFFARSTKELKVIVNKQLLPSSIYSLFSTTLALGALFLGMDIVSVLESNIISSIIPLLIVVAGAIVFKERVPSREKLGAFIAFLGTCIAIVFPVLEGYESSSHWLGIVFILLYMASDVVSALMAKGLLRRKVSAAAMTNYSFIFGFITTLPLVMLQTPLPDLISQIMALPFQYHLGVWYMAVLSGSVAYYLRNSAQKTIEVGDAGLFAYLIPVFSAPLAIFWLGEDFTLPLLIGAIFIITGVTIAEMKGLTRKKFKLHLPHIFSGII